MTICNTGALATGGHGTALGMASVIMVMISVVMITFQSLSQLLISFKECVRCGVPWSKELLSDCMSISNLQH